MGVHEIERSWAGETVHSGRVRKTAGRNDFNEGKESGGKAGGERERSAGSGVRAVEEAEDDQEEAVTMRRWVGR